MHPSNFINRLRMAALVVLFGLVASSALAQAPDSGLLDAPDLKLLSDGEVRATAYMPDGSLVVGGSFGYINGKARRNLARILANGEVDPDWRPEPDRTVTSLTVDAAGNIYVGGNFSRIGGQDHMYLSKIPPGSLGQADPLWLSGNGLVGAYPIRIIVSMDGSTIFAATRGWIRKISSSGVVASGWGQQVSSVVYDIALGADDNLYVAGSGLYPPEYRRLLRMSANGLGEVDTTWDPQPSDRVSALSIDEVGDALIVGGSFTEIGGQTRAGLARIPYSSNGGIDTAWMPQVVGIVRSLSNVADGTLFALVYDQTQPATSAARLRKFDVAAGTADPDWQHDVAGSVFAMGVASGRSLVTGGLGMSVAGVASFNLVLLPSSGESTQPVFEVGYPGSVYAIARQTNGGTIIGGMFEWAGGMSRSNLLRLKPDGTLDPLWNPAPDIDVSAIVIDAEDDVFVGGGFRSIGGQALRGLAKVSGSGNGLVHPLPSVGDVNALCYDGLGNLFVGGYLDALAGQSRRGLVKVVRSDSGDWQIDDSWAPPTDLAYDLTLDAARNLYAAVDDGGTVGVHRFSADGAGQADPGWTFQVAGSAFTLALDDSQRLYVGGDFVLGEGLTQANLVRVGTGSTAVVDTAWSPLIDGAVLAIAIGADGRVYAGRENTGSEPPQTLVSRFSGTGAGLVDASWDAGIVSEYWGGVSSILVEPGNRVLVGGGFSEVGSSQRFGLAAYGDSIFSGEFDRLPAD